MSGMLSAECTQMAARLLRGGADGANEARRINCVSLCKNGKAPAHVGRGTVAPKMQMFASAGIEATCNDLYTTDWPSHVLQSRTMGEWRDCIGVQSDTSYPSDMHSSDPK